MKGPIRILYLDDEEQNLISFQAMFRREFEIYTTTEPSNAVKYLTENEIHIIFSDQKMPEISGVEFFEMIQPEFPEAIRILLTGYADIEAVIDAINKGQVWRYLTKPWNENELRITIEDAHEMFYARRQVNEKSKALEKAYSELQKFVYSASHDLRAPLVSIKGVLNLARAENDPSKNTEYLNLIERSVIKLDSFVQNIIQYYQNNKKEELLSAVTFTELISEVFENYSHYDGAENVNFKMDVNQHSPISIDELRIKIILNNLVNNAIKFRDAAKEHQFVNVEFHQLPNKAILKVSDNGQGILKQDLPLIFDMFYRTSHKNIGTGIGLYIVKEAIDKLKGKINVTSEPDQGSSFNIEIPISQ